LPQRDDFGLTFAGFLILAALGTFLWERAPLESARPTSAEGGWYDRYEGERMPARLWQDPFKAIHAYQQARAEGGLKPATWSDIQQDIKQVARDDGQVVVLAAMVSPGSYSELEERRRRRRYAVLSALGASGFVPRDAEALRAFPLRFHVCDDYASTVTTYLVSSMSHSSSTGSAKDEQSPSLYVPYEWYDHESPSPKPKNARSVVVLWLDESKFADKPFCRLQQLVDYILGKTAGKYKRNIETIVLGPARSGTLRKMVENRYSASIDQLRDQSGLAGFYILSSTATVADADLLGKWPPKDEKSAGEAKTGDEIRLLGEKFSQSDCDPKAAPKQTCLRFLRTIRSDDKLIRSLVGELRKRHILPDKDTTVVISEWDTYFGRFLPRAFALEYCGEPEPCEHLLRYTYQRGIDGITVGEEGAPPVPADIAKDAKQEGAEFPLAGTSSVRRPVGTGQFDYLRRLASAIGNKDRELRLAGGNGVRAVAILGSDVYDKMLILRALRHQLPGAVWLTTDLDAQLLHPAEFKWARNLIVGSTYGLRLPDDIESSTPRFRDSYQTSVYLTTRLAVDERMLSKRSCITPPENPTFGRWVPSQRQIYECLPPQLFEVGRHGAVLLPEANQNKKTINRIASESFAGPIAVGLFFLAVLGIVGLHQLRPKSGRPVVMLSGLLLALVVLTVVAVRLSHGGEPLSFMAGISIWPTEYIRLVAIFLTLFFIWSVVNPLRANWQTLNERYFRHRAGVPPTEELTLGQLLGNMHLTLGPIPPWILLSAALVLLVMASMIAQSQFDFGLTNTLIAMIPVWGLLIGFWRLAIMGKIWPSIEVRSINRWVTSESITDVSGLWREYCEHGELRHRFLRALAHTLVYMAFASITFALLGFPEVPCRGAACGVDNGILGVSVLLMLFLLFLVVDATNLCIYWIELLQDCPLEWARGHNEKLSNFPEAHRSVWMRVHLIGERTAEVARLIYYPMLIILLLLLARSTYFDDWGFPQALAVIIGLNFLVALAAAIRLNYVARTARSQILDELRQEQLTLIAAEPGGGEPKPTGHELRELIAQLENLRIGAYQKIWDQPTVRATLLLLGGIGLTYWEYFPLF
jgi:hypothetical protein